MRVVQVAHGQGMSRQRTRQPRRLARPSPIGRMMIAALSALRDGWRTGPEGSPRPGEHCKTARPRLRLTSGCFFSQGRV